MISADSGQTPAVGLALVGTGMVAPVIADAVHRCTGVAELRGVAASTLASAQRFVEQQASILPDGCKAYGSVDEIASDRSVELVLVATPPDARAGVVAALTGAGKHVLLEKPIERNLAAATAIVDAADRAAVTLGVFLQHRHKASVRRMAELFDGGALGALGLVEVSVPWWRPQAYYDEPGRGSYARDGGGVLLTQAIHTLDVMLSLTGPVHAVTALTATTKLHAMEAEDFASVGLEFANGAVGNLMATTSAFPGAGEFIRLHFEGASARLQGDVLTLTWRDGRSETFGQEAATGSGANPMAFSSEWHAAVVADMVAAVAEGRPPLVSGRDALGVHALVDGIERSATAGARVELDRNWSERALREHL